MNIIKPGDICEFRSSIFFKIQKEVFYCICLERKFNFKVLCWQYIFYNINSHEYYSLDGGILSFSLFDSMDVFYTDNLTRAFSYCVKKI